jgi:hypothetical protein
MTRRGKCRCGNILQFEETSLGFKTRCPRCKAVVRLRLDATTPAPQSGKSPASPPPLPEVPEPNFIFESPPAPTLDGPPPVGPPDFSVLSNHESTAPAALAEMDAYRGPESAPSSVGWWVFALVMLLVILAVTIAALLWG